MDHARDRARRAASPAAAVPVARGLSQARRMADACVSSQSAPRPRGAQARMVRRRHDGPDRAFGLPRRRCRRLSRAGPSFRRGQGCRSVGQALPRPLLPRGAARGPLRRRCAERLDCGHRRGVEASRCRDASGGVSQSRRISCTRGAGVHRRGLYARRPASAEALHARAVLHDAGRDGEALRGSARSIG